MRIIDELTHTEEMTMRQFELTYHAVDPAKPDLGPYTVTATGLDRAVDLVIPMIKQDHPGIDLQKDYNPLPHAMWRDL